MGKKQKINSDLGRALIKDRFGGPKARKFVGDKSMLHTTEVQDGYDWGRLNLQSVTEESSFQEFLATAELAGTEFQAEKLNIKFINPKVNVGLLTEEEKRAVNESQEKNRELITIPRRPAWTKDMGADELDQNEREHFLTWRRTLADLQEKQGVLLTPFEKNLEFWRQLWRVIERSDVIVQIVDARNPLLFRCDDLEKYVTEVSKDKLNLILINKADFLTSEQRQFWADYFSSLGVHVVFFSAITVPTSAEIEESSSENEECEDESSEEEEHVEKSLADLHKSVQKLEHAVECSAQEINRISKKIEEMLDEQPQISNSSAILSRDGLIEFFKTFHKGERVTKNLSTIGLVGYPNVGKSSTINALLCAKKVSVSATPGKTKHFQTLFLDDDLLLCDCPGLVMPSFVYTKAEMIINGILPIDQMRDHVPPINLITSLIPRHIFEDKYGLMLPLPMECEDQNRGPTAEELLNAYGYNRGFMTSNGQPDNPRAARYILKDFVNGKLLYSHAPPGVDQNIYHTWPKRQRLVKANRVLPPQEARAIRSLRATPQDIDKTFFNLQSNGAHVKGKSTEILSGSSSNGNVENSKPWKQENRHKNKNKREKLRKLYIHLDKH
ncbi:hypothetical protein PPYR_09582 [Photinus pyralis]|uniref:Large subunit GTPase 1 homolog n=1 Tax=Photinus pyralis TaxID=7054 RepID=A0A1Y1KNS8_PHOPY|nr:large subunit GTPase 1 homolog [Photinus pyralis]KAB0798589.1 hypothetical protein PPYR_09582 [Photinus pyralis]